MSKHIQKRMVFASVFRSRKFLRLWELAGDATPFCHSLFIMILTHADDHGRYSGEPAVVKMEYSSCLLPIVSFEAGITTLEKAGLITRYEVAGEKFVHIVNFHEWQFLRYQADPEYPAPQQNGTMPRPKRSGGKKKKRAEPDDRVAPLRDFLVQEYRRIRGVEVFTDDSDWVNLARMLRITKGKDGFDLDALKDSWTLFLGSGNRFYREQGHPIRYWASNINAFRPAKGDLVGARVPDNEIPIMTREVC